MSRRILATLAAMALGAGTLLAQATRKSTPHQTTPTGRQATVRRSLDRPSSLNRRAPETYRAKFTTTQGDFVIEVTRAWAPLGADRFYNLVRYGFYTDASFFRVLSGFVAQFGISAKPAIAVAWSNATIKDDPVAQSNLRGYVTFATAGANTRTTQVFINLADNSRLDGAGFASFGKVVEGMGVVEKLYSGYGEGAPQGNGPDQGRITAEGKAYLDKNFPKLDSIKAAVILPQPRPAAPAAHAATPPRRVQH